MKSCQFQLGSVPAKLWRLNLGFIALVLLAFAVACTDSPPPIPTSTPAPTPTATPTPTPTPAFITIGLEEDPDAFLQAIPAGERECIVQAFGTESLIEVIDAGPPSSEGMAKFTDCLTEETARRLMLGAMMMDLGISEQDITS